jgi:hypothetical protein
MFKILPLLLLLGCSADEYTWGDLTREVATGYCTALAECGNNAELCTEHAVWHLCVADDSCGDEISRPDSVDECLAALDGFDNCFVLRFGFLPESCREALNRE